MQRAVLFQFADRVYTAMPRSPSPAPRLTAPTYATPRVLPLNHRVQRFLDTPAHTQLARAAITFSVCGALWSGVCRSLFML